MLSDLHKWRHSIFAIGKQMTIVKTALRVPEQLHERLHKSAEDAGRSYNAEIIKRLEDSYSPSASNLAAFGTGALIDELLSRFPPGDVGIRIGRPMVLEDDE